MEAISIRTAVVNGTTGAVGSALTKHLLDLGVTVYAVIRPTSQRTENIPEGAQIVRCDLMEIERLPEMIDTRVDAFFHLAWAHPIGPGRNDMIAQTENIRCSIQAVRAAKELGCQVFVGAGSQAEYGRIEGKVTADAPCFPTTGYGMAKLCAGQMTRMECQRLGMRHAWARILSVYGPHDGPLSVIPMMMDKLLKGEKPALTKGEQMWDYLYSADAADALWRMALSGRDGSVYPVGSGTVRPLKEYFMILRDAINPELPLGLGELPYGPGQVMRLQADISALQRDTGFTPSTPFEAGIRETLRQYQAEQTRKEARKQ